MEKEEIRDRIDAIIELLAVVREELGESARQMDDAPKEGSEEEALSSLSVLVYFYEASPEKHLAPEAEKARGRAYVAERRLAAVLREEFPEWPCRVVNGMAAVARSLSADRVCWIEGWEPFSARAFLRMMARQADPYSSRSLRLARFRGESWVTRQIGPKASAIVRASLGSD